MPTIREHSNYAHLVIDNIKTISSDLEYEILVYSPIEIYGDKVKWFEDKTLDGCVSGFNFLLNKASEEYVTTSVDDKIYKFLMKDVIYFMESDLFKTRKIKICAIGHEVTTTIPSPSRPHKQGIVPHIVENDIRILAFLVANRKNVFDYMNGYLFHPRFKHHWSDNYLSYWLDRVFKESHYECPNTTMDEIGDRATKTITIHDDYDFKVFCDLVKKIEIDNYKKYV